MGLGPWITEPPFEDTNSVTSGDRWMTAYFEVLKNYPLLTPEDYVAVQNDATTASPNLPYSADPTLGSAKMAYRWTQDEVAPGDPDGRSEVFKAREVYRALTISPYTEGVVWFSPSVAPDNVIGVQYEDDPTVYSLPHPVPASVVSAELNGKLDGIFRDDRAVDGHLLHTFATDVRADLSAPFDSSVEQIEYGFGSDSFIDHADWGPESFGYDFAPGGDFVATYEGPVPADYTTGRDVDSLGITPFLDDKGRTVLFTKMNNPNIPGPLAEDLVTGINGVVQYGYHLAANMTVSWVFQPPTYRFVLDGPAPPLRRKQRDDDGVNGVRNRRAASSRQRSLRNTGYL